MDNWFVNKDKIKNKTINAIMGELEYLLDEPTRDKTANYWIDQTHNVFAFINDNSNNDRWIEIHYELHNYEDIIGDLSVWNTEYIDRDELLMFVKMIVNDYYGDCYGD